MYWKKYKWTGYLGPGGLHMDNQYNSSCVGGAAGYIDRWILGINHIYSNPTPKPIYGSGPFDPEGILGMVYFFSQPNTPLTPVDLRPKGHHHSYKLHQIC